MDIHSKAARACIWLVGAQLLVKPYLVLIWVLAGDRHMGDYILIGAGIAAVFSIAFEFRHRRRAKARTDAGMA